MDLRSTRRAILIGLAAAALIELVTCALRFGAGMESTRDTMWLAPWTFGLRIHHGYIGIALLALAAAIRARSWRNVCLALGIALAASDLAHHFLVLWLFTGSPQFHLHY